MPEYHSFSDSDNDAGSSTVSSQVSPDRAGPGDPSTVAAASGYDNGGGTDALGVLERPVVEFSITGLLDDLHRAGACFLFVFVDTTLQRRPTRDCSGRGHRVG